MADYAVIQTTVDSREQADRLAADLVEKRLAACVQVLGPIQSHYWWEGKVQSSQEWICAAKTRSDLYGAVEQALAAMHPYDVPEIIATPITNGAASYLAWLSSEVARPT